MKQDLGFRKNESLSVLVTLGIQRSLRDRLAAEKRHLRHIKRTAQPLKRYRFDL